MRKSFFAFISVMLMTPPLSIAQSEDELEAMQSQLNGEVMEKPFSAADEARIEAFITAASKSKLKPEVDKAPSYWRPGYTCADIYGYGWNAYRNCRYYHHYYGSYWH